MIAGHARMFGAYPSNPTAVRAPVRGKTMVERLVGAMKTMTDPSEA
jgi:hypothetical protein